MTLVLNGKGLLLEGSNPKIEDKQVPDIIYIQWFFESCGLNIYIIYCLLQYHHNISQYYICFFGGRLARLNETNKKIVVSFKYIYI